LVLLFAPIRIAGSRSLEPGTRSSTPAKPPGSGPR
jgi:hypothetical protein